MFACPVCDVKLNSAEQRRAHCRGKNHIKREEARKKAQELGTDFDSTPDHCDICNVPLTSKMTAIDHFKGKLHQKKIKAVDEQRQGFKNYCEICEVRLQSLKVSEAHFNGKQHRKRERKSHSGRGQSKKNPSGGKSDYNRPSQPITQDFSQNKNIFCANMEETLKTSSWESVNCENDTEPKDILSEFRNSLSGKSLSSPDTTSLSSPETLNEPFFSFNTTPIVSNASIQMLPNTTVSHTGVRETIIPGRRPPVLKTNLRPPKGLESCYKENLPKLKQNTQFNVFCESQGIISDFNEVYSRTLPFASDESRSLDARNEHFMKTQAVLRVLRKATQAVSSGDVANKIPGLSPSDVNIILCELEANHLVSKSGHVPFLWSLRGSTDYTPSSPTKHSQRKQNGFPPNEKTSHTTLSHTGPFEASKNPNQKNVLNSEATYAPLTAAILAPCSFSTTTTTIAPSEYIANFYGDDVIESNLVNVLEQNSLTMNEIKEKLKFRDESRLLFILRKLLERNAIVKDEDQRWRLASLTRNSVGVIGEERKRKCSVQSEGSETSRDRTPTPPKENSYSISNDYHTATGKTSRSLAYVSPSKKSSCPMPNSFDVSDSSSRKSAYCPKPPNHLQNCEKVGATNGYIKPDRCNNIFQNRSNEGMNAKLFHNATLENNGKPSRSSPLLDFEDLKTETSEVLEDLTVTIPKTYQKELYTTAMEEDTVCYVPCGTGKNLVIAQVIAHMAILNPNKQALVIVPDIVSALNVAHVLRKELGSKSQRKKLNVALYAGSLKQSTGSVQVVVATSSTCLGLLNCGALAWKDISLLIFDNAIMCCTDDPSNKILHEYYLKAKMDFRNGHVPKLLSFFDSSAGRKNHEETLQTFGNVLSTMGDIFLSCVSESINELQQDKRAAMLVCVQATLNQKELNMFVLLKAYLNLVFDNLAAQWQPLNSYRELLHSSFQDSKMISDAFVKLIHLTGPPLEKRIPQSCLKTWRHYLAICEAIFALMECGEDLALELLVNLSREQFGFVWANKVGLPGYKLSGLLIDKDIPTWDSSLASPRGSGLKDLIDQLTIIQWENARVSSERPLALVIVKLNKIAELLASYLARCPELIQRNVKTTFVDGSRCHQQKVVMSAIKRRQYQIIVSTDNINEELPHCELVVLMDQPSSVFVLEQLRTRRATNVVAICQDDGGESRLKDLLRREELVEKAVASITKSVMT